MNRLQPALTCLVIVTGLVTLLASSLTDEDEDEPAVPVTVNYTLQTAGTGLSRALETRRGIASGMQLTGSYDANSGDGLSLDRSIVNFDATSGFSLQIVPSGDEVLTGTAMIDITSTIDYGLDRDPTVGRFSSDFDGTTTVVDVTSSGVDLLVGDATQAVSLSWSDFEAREDDADANLDERMASAAYNMLSAILRAVVAIENMVSDVESDRDMLESIGVVSTVDGLDVDCDNRQTDDGDSPMARLTWTFDATGTGQGELGAGDSFVAEYRNCRDSRTDRFLDGTVLFSDYFPDRGAGLRMLEVTAEISQLFNSEVAVADFDTVASAASPLYDGFLTLDYVEVNRSTL